MKPSSKQLIQTPKKAFVIGGGEIYKEAIPFADKVYLTRVHTTVEGDTSFPAMQDKEWKLFSNMDFEADARHAYAYSFQVWDRKITPDW
jgi:dihydrofolate reductase